MFASIVLVAACSKKSPPPAYTGALTFERIDQAREAVHVRDDWSESLAKVQAIAGPPTSKTDTKAAWALSDGGACASFEIERKDDHVSSKSNQPKINKASFDGTSTIFTDCEALARAK